MVRSVPDDPGSASGLSSQDLLRGQSPLSLARIDPYGRFEVDFDRRIDFKTTAARASLWILIVKRAK